MTKLNAWLDNQWVDIRVKREGWGDTIIKIKRRQQFQKVMEAYKVQLGLQDKTLLWYWSGDPTRPLSESDSCTTVGIKVETSAIFTVQICSNDE